MKRLIFIIFLSAMVCAQAQYRKNSTVLLNDLKVTPGAVRTTNKKLICDGGSTSKIRNVTTAEKNLVYKEYGVTKKSKVCCEVDHLISLELGGSNDVKNLWPQPYLPKPGAHEKDVLENWLHKQICIGKITPEEAQKKISTDWYAAYLEMKYGH